MRLCAFTILSVLLVLFASRVSAIFADEAYQTDYHHALLGIPQAYNTFFHRPSASSKASLLYTLSERQVLGAVNPKDGAVIWRQRLDDSVSNDTSSQGFLKAAENSDVLVTAYGEKIQVWDATDGRLVREHKSAGTVQNLETLQDQGDVLVLSGGLGFDSHVQRLVSSNGQTSWDFTDSSGDKPYAIVSSADRIIYISLHSALRKGLKIKVTELASTTGLPIGQPILLSSENEITSKESIVHVGVNSGTPFIVWVDKTFTTLKVNVLGTKKITTFNVPSSGGTPVTSVVVHAARSATANPDFLAHYQGVESHWADVFHIDSGAPKKVYGLSSASGKGAFSASSHGSDVYFMRHTTLEDVLLSPKGSSVLKQWDASHRSEPKPRAIGHAVSEVVPRSGSTYAVRSAVSFLSGDWELTRNGDLSWLRSEGLTGVVASAFVDIVKVETLAEELAAEGQSYPLTAYLHRIKRHAKDLEHFPAWAETITKRVLSSFLGDQSLLQDHEVRRDSFGFRKIVLVATESGRLAALDAGSQGKVLWNIQAVILEPTQTWDVLSIEDEGGLALIRGKEGEFLRIDTRTGIIRQYQPGGTIQNLMTTIPVMDRSGNKVTIPVNANGSPGPIPQADLAIGTVLVTKENDDAVKGWRLTTGRQPTPAWQFKPKPGYRISNIVARPSHDPIASIGKALGDRNVLYKYLNPNLILVTAIEKGLSTVVFYLIDSTSGAVIHSIIHPKVNKDKPIVSTMSENWFAYSLFSESTVDAQGIGTNDAKKLASYQLVVAELYESPFANDRGSLGSSLNASSIYPTDQSENDVTESPHVVSQTFLIPGPISSLSVSSTLQGITTRSLLGVIPELKSIISISRAFLDPRRPVGRDPTSAEIEEGLFRYNPVLDFEPKWILNHKRDTLSISKMLTSPSLLESTSLVFGYGDIDLFGTRTAPIGAFDILGKGFNKLQLVLTVFALAVGTLIVAPFVRRKQIDGLWKA